MHVIACNINRKGNIPLLEEKILTPGALSPAETDRSQTSNPTVASGKSNILY